MTQDTMKAVVFKGPYKVAIEDRPIPKIQEPTDIIVKVDKVCTNPLFLWVELTGRLRYVEGMNLYRFAARDLTVIKRTTCIPRSPAL